MFFRARFVWLAILIVLGSVILYSVVLLPLRSANAAQTVTPRPALQMKSSTFPDQNLPEDGSTVTLISIPFTTDAVAKVEATSLIDAHWGGNSCCGQGGPTVTETTVMAIDGVELGSSSWASNATLPAQLSITRTLTGLAPGNHVLTVKCTGSSDAPGGMNVLAHSGGTSVIIVSGA